MSKPIDSAPPRTVQRYEFQRLVDRVERLGKIQDLLVGEIRRLQQKVDPAEIECFDLEIKAATGGFDVVSG